ncbi:LysR family transcriptional regulator [Microbacterium oxydans]|uniref:HTH-type transcriptional regulator DmlR n=1 Tax=Microbacterium oxydans TaxID=82380 RepID=A0A0F0LMA7_9MICO|nr:LysR family transcriptional regulator [Microbacterium oxydans]KJL33819.1 HTH-type transcriptional regulator DmlR [Microbacterium oxydans]
MAHFPTPPLSADDLLVLLAVARSGRYTAAGEHLGLNHTTIARRIAALEAQLGGRVLTREEGVWELTPLGTRALTAAEDVERALGGLDTHDDARVEGLIRLSATDGFSGFVAAPAMAALQQRHPDVRLEIITGTRQASQQRAGADLEVVVGRPQVRRARAVHLADYALGLYASKDYLRRHPTPRTVEDLAGAPLVYFIESMLHVDSLDDARRAVPGMTDAVASTNVYVHVDATRGGAGFGLLPAFLADAHDDLVRVLPGIVEERLPYWLVARPEALRQPAVSAFLDALQERLTLVRPQLLGAPRVP